MELKLRDYQSQAIAKILWSQQLEGNDLCILPTGAGKSVVIAYLAKQLGKPILILQPSKEILEQNYKKLCLYVDPKDIGIYSASMNEKTIRYYTFATIQSIYQKPEEFKHFPIVLIDECHLVNPKNLGGMFTSFLKQIGNPKVIGFTATPYRMGLGYRMNLWGDFEAYAATKLINRMKERFWSRIIFNINNGELLEKGYLAPLEYTDMSVMEHEDIPMNKSRSDFDLEALDTKLTARQEQLLEGVTYAGTIAKSVLIFCSSVKQATKFAAVTPNAAFVTGKTDKKERARVIDAFKSGKIKYVFNVGVLTTGFDHPELDGIVLIRPTRSIGLYYQMLGRGVRIHPNKKSCKVIDLTSTVKNLGKIETIKLEKVENKWELLSERGAWHNREMYSFVVKTKEQREEEEKRKKEDSLNRARGGI